DPTNAKSPGRGGPQRGPPRALAVDTRPPWARLRQLIWRGLLHLAARGDRPRRLDPPAPVPVGHVVEVDRRVDVRGEEGSPVAHRHVTLPPLPSGIQPSVLVSRGLVGPARHVDEAGRAGVV